MVLKPCKSWDSSEAVSLVLQIWIYFWYFNGWILHDFSSPAAMVVDQLFRAPMFFDCNRQPSWPSQFLQMLAKHLGKTNPMMLVPQVHSPSFSGVGEQHAVFWTLFPEYGKGAVAQVKRDLFFFFEGGWVVFGERLFFELWNFAGLESNRRFEGSLGNY